VADDRPTTHRELVALLDDVRPLIRYPGAEGIAPGVRHRLEVERGTPGARARPTRIKRLHVLAAAAVILALVVSAILLVPSSRHAVADLLGLRGVQIE
jgi:hypothetical protein